MDDGIYRVTFYDRNYDRARGEERVDNIEFCLVTDNKDCTFDITSVKPIGALGDSFKIKGEGRISKSLITEPLEGVTSGELPLFLQLNDKLEDKMKGGTVMIGEKIHVHLNYDGYVEVEKVAEPDALVNLK